MPATAIASPLRLLLLAGALLLPAGPSPAAPPPADPPEKLKAVVVDGAFSVETRLKAAVDLARAGPALLGDALVELGEKAKDPANLDFLVRYVCSEEVRHLRVLGAWAAWQTNPEGAAAAFLAAASAEDDKQAGRAVDAAGLILPLGKDRSLVPRLVEIATGPRVYPGIEAARALNRIAEPRLLRDIVAAAVQAVDNHVRKHLVWIVVDLEDEKGAARIFEGMKGKKGEEGENAKECWNIVLDRGSEPFTWRRTALKEVGDWWKKGRPPGGAVTVGIGDKGTQEKVGGWIKELEKEAPAWAGLVHATLHRIDLRTNKAAQIFDAKKKSLFIDAAEIARCETPWQGAYVLARDGCIALCAILGEPDTGHRGWEPAYFDIHSFYKTTKRNAGGLEEFVDKAIGGKPWPTGGE
ncbi:MAG: hypothetical protein HUU06_08535 [Planctomycetaceae bacterium]|nr:hypothetical protein [Planctomycetota bacterium]NUN52817.1 hypothetical protein [Planctomycetaceae bacterium]